MTDLTVLTSGKIRFGKNHLDVVADDLGSEDIRQILPGLAAMQEASMFWLGDFCLELEKRLKQPVSAIAKAYGCRPSQLYRARKVCSFFPKAKRKPALSFTHHQAAMEAAPQQPETALEHLNDAAENHWTTRELRAHLPTAGTAAAEAAARAPEPATLAAEPGGENFDRAMDRLCAARQLLREGEFTPQQRRQLAALLGELSVLLKQP